MNEDPAWDAVEAMSAAVDRLVAADLSGDPLGLADVVEEVARKVAVVQQRVTAELIAQDVPGELGASISYLLQQRLRLSAGEVKSRLARAEDLTPRRALTGEPLPARLPATAGEQAEGAISVEHAKVIQHTMKSLPAAVDPGTWADAEADLAGRARQFTPKDLGVLARHLRACLDPDGTLATERELVERRELSFARDVDGSYAVRGRLDPEGAEIVKVALDALAADGTPDPRSPARRQADALVELAGRAIRGDTLPASGGRPTQVLLSVSLADLHDRLGLTELSHTGSPVSIETVLRMACEAEIIPTVFDPDNGQVLYLGRAQRLASRHQRNALIARDRGCAAPGCDAPPAWTQAHHLVHWAHGGKTDLDNLVLLCGRHHRAVHTGHWKLTTVGGVPQVRPPPWANAA